MGLNNLFSLIIIVIFSLSPVSLSARSPVTGAGEWVLLQKSIGVSAMHAQLLKNNKVVIFDRTDFGPSNLTIAGDKCRHNDAVMKVDCTAHSILYDIASNTYRPLNVHTDVWCSSGAVHPDGTLVQTGGYRDGERKIRLYAPCEGDDAVSDCDWIELPQNLTSKRWYSSNQILPDGRIIIVGGRKTHSYEFFPKNPEHPSSMALYQLPFLKETRDKLEENNLYPFLHLLPDGNLFIFANRRSISFDYINNRIIKEFPIIPGEKRTYPATGSSVMLPLRLSSGKRSPEVEVMICGGAHGGAYYRSDRLGVYMEASKTCARMKVTDSDPKWTMESMPMPRVMPDMILLPTGDVLIINGATNGTAGWEDAVGAVLTPVLYNVKEHDPIKKFCVLTPTTIPRMYHSTTILLSDGRILVGGSNPHQTYNFTAPLYHTQLSLEAFLPPYLGPQYKNLQPMNVSIPNKVIMYGQSFWITFRIDELYQSKRKIMVTMISPAFNTHSNSMNQRLLILDKINVEKLSACEYRVNVNAPPTRNIAPPGYYMVFVVHDGVPGKSVWVKIM